MLAGKSVEINGRTYLIGGMPVHESLEIATHELERQGRMVEALGGADPDGEVTLAGGGRALAAWARDWQDGAYRQKVVLPLLRGCVLGGQPVAVGTRLNDTLPHEALADLPVLLREAVEHVAGPFLGAARNAVGSIA